jgi:glycosyltransferase involved in cell wall biosynthesis
MTHQPQVSIILPCLNARPYLEPRIESLLAQTYSNWEAIVLDSHSTDGSWEFFKSVAATDSRFRLYQVPCEGLYAALNRGLELTAGEFLHIATCDDTMVPEFLTAMLGVFDRCPEAGIAACDALLINRNGAELSAEDLSGYLPMPAIKDLLDAGIVRSAFPGKEKQEHINYRPVPHDCLLHFDGRSVYFSLPQLLVRMELAKAAAPFETTVGSIADFGWVLRLTNLTGSVHLPKKLATWRFHGDQLSVRRDDSRLAAMKMIYVRALPEIYERNRDLLSWNDCAALLLPCKASLANSLVKRAGCRFEAIVRLLGMFLERPALTLRAVRRSRFRFGTLRRSLLPMIFERTGLVPKELNLSEPL